MKSKQYKIFPYIVALSAGLVAFSAAFFSVYGLSKLFAGATSSVIIMAGSLEFAKLVSASFLYRYWDKVPGFLKNYLLIGTLILVVITSAGIFGFLSNAYQGATIDFEKQSTLLVFKVDKLEQLQEDKIFLKKELKTAISELPDNYMTAKRALRDNYQPQITELNQKILDTKHDMGELKTKLVDTGVDVGPAIYLARIFNTEIDTVVKWFIFLLIFVFDPLAVSLVIAANMAFDLAYVNKEEKDLVEGWSAAEIIEPIKRKGAKWWELYRDKEKAKEAPKEDVKEESIEKPILQRGGIDVTGKNK
jgi:hypothetical protein